MKTTLILTTILLTLTGFLLYPGIVVTLDELSNPFVMQVDKNQLYIADGASVFIYSLKDYQLQKKFGKRGEAPGEFLVNPNIFSGSVLVDVYPDYLLINSPAKLSFFSKQGKFIKEIRSVSLFGGFKPLGDRYVGYGTVFDNNEAYLTVNIWDAKLKKVLKELHREKQWGFTGAKLDAFDFRGIVFFVADNKIFVENENQNILILTETGERIDSIEPPTEPIKMTENFKKGFHDFLKTSPKYKQFYQNIKHLIIFPRYFPKIRYLVFSPELKIFVLSWKQKDGKCECFVYDLKGKLEKKIYLPVNEQTGFFYFSLTFGNDKFYQLIEDEDEEAWQLQVTELK